MLIKVEHLRREFSPEVIPLRDMNCEIEEGDVVSIIGPSGTGKSTFLNLMNRLDVPTSGKIWFEGEDTTAPGYDLNRMRQRMGMVFQSFNLFSHLTLAENIMLGPVNLMGKGRQEAYETSLRLLNTVGLEDRSMSYPSELSGGQQQRAAIARAMAMEPRVLLFDEPTSALDPTMVNEVLNVIRNLAKEGVTMLIVTHEMRFARNVSNRVFYLDEGGVYEEGTPLQIFDHPRRPRTRLFVQNIKSFRWSAEKAGLNPFSPISEFEVFAYRNMMNAKLIQRYTLFIEEFFAQAQRLGRLEGAKLQIYTEYSEDAQRLDLRVEWENVPIRPLEEGDEYSRILLRHVCPDANQTAEGNLQRLTGSITIGFK